MNTLILSALVDLTGAAGAAPLDGGGYRIDLVGGSSRAATQGEILDANKQARIAQINAECRARLVTRFGDAAEQVSRSIGVYGAAEKAALESGIAATIDASNAASDLVLAAADVATVEAVTVAWPVI